MGAPTSHRSRDLTIPVSTAGTGITGSNPKRDYVALVNHGTGYIDVMKIGEPGAKVEGRLRLYPGGSIVFSKTGDMPWDGSISATSEIDLDVLGGEEVYSVP